MPFLTILHFPHQHINTLNVFYIIFNHIITPNSSVMFYMFHPCNLIFYSPPTPSLIPCYSSIPPPPGPYIPFLLLQAHGNYKLPLVTLATNFLKPEGGDNLYVHLAYALTEYFK